MQINRDTWRVRLADGRPEGDAPRDVMSLVDRRNFKPPPVGIPAKQVSVVCPFLDYLISDQCLLDSSR